MIEKREAASRGAWQLSNKELIEKVWKRRRKPPQRFPVIEAEEEAIREHSDSFRIRIQLKCSRNGRRAPHKGFRMLLNRILVENNGQERGSLLRGFWQVSS